VRSRTMAMKVSSWKLPLVRYALAPAESSIRSSLIRDDNHGQVGETVILWTARITDAVHAGMSRP
jgi:hypothetical protein